MHKFGKNTVIFFNKGNATFDDMNKLINHVSNEVFKKWYQTWKRN